MIGPAGLPQRARHAAKVLLGWAPVTRGLTVFPEDRFVVSYPKSGNTWVRFLVANCLSDGLEPVGFAELEGLVPDIYRHRDLQLRRLPRPRILKSHEPFDPRYRRVVYLVRDPRDVAVSYYHFQIRKRKLPDGAPIEPFVREFLEGGVGRYGNWREHVGGWLGARRGTEGFCVVRYEDLLADVEGELERILSVLGIGAGEERRRAAVEASRASRLRRLEEEEGAARMFGSREDKPFVRRAASGGWSEELPPEWAERIVARWADLLSELGYLGSS